MAIDTNIHKRELETDGQTDGPTNRQIDGQTERRNNKQTDRKGGREKENERIRYEFFKR